LAQSRVRTVHQLHALLRALLAGGAPRDLSPTTAAELLRTLCQRGVEQAHKAVAEDFLSEIRSLDTQLKTNARVDQAHTLLLRLGQHPLGEVQQKRDALASQD
jgi:transposase